MLKKPNSKSILSFSKSGLAHLAQQIDQQRLVLKQIRAVLSEDLGIHVMHCLARNDKLILYTDSSAWASQLRFYQASILAAVNPKITNLEIKVISRLDNQYKFKPSPPVIPSQAVINEIRNVSCYIGDKQLKQALERLSITLSQAKAKQ